MKQLTPRISIGIPAYNEERNIRALLKNILAQRVSVGELTEIIVFSDGSSDRTNDEVRAVRDDRIIFIDSKERRGQSLGQNEILIRATGDVLILLNADVLPVRNDFIDEISAPILANASVGLVGGATVPVPTEHFFEEVIARGHRFKVHVYEGLNGRDNLYLCQGAVRAFSKPLYKEFRWKDGYPEDSFSYLSAQAHGFRFAYAPEAQVYFRVPGTMSDHLKQSHRFASGAAKLAKHFGEDKIDEAYKIPRTKILEMFTKSIFRDPLHMISYAAVLIYARFFARKVANYSSHWDVSQSSKKLFS